MIIAFNKPYGVLSQFNENPDTPGQRTLTEFGLPPKFYPVGRLDQDSEGLLLLSDDPAYERHLMRPAHEHTRSYLVQVDGKFDHEAQRSMSAGGLDIQNYKTKPCKVQLLTSPRMLPAREPAVDPIAEQRSSWIVVTLKEGKNRQVRRMTAKVGYPTLRLFRISIGEYDVSEVKPGEFVVLSEDEEKLLQK